MKRKVGVAIILVSLIVTSVAIASDEPPWEPDGKVSYGWRDLEWEFSDDFTKVKIKENGECKEYKNYVLLVRNGEYIKFINMGAVYLLDAYEQGDCGVDEYFTKVIKRNVENIIDGCVGFYPENEILSINYEPWQESDFKEYIIQKYREEYCFFNERPDVWEFVQDSRNNGYGKEVFGKGKSIDEAKKDLKIDRLNIGVYKEDLYKNSEELHKDIGPLGEKENPSDTVNEKYGYKEYSQKDFKLFLKDKSKGYENVEKTEVTKGSDKDYFGDEETSKDKLDSGKTVKLSVGSKSYEVTGSGGGLKEFSCEPVVKEGVLYIPLRGVLESLGCEVGWFSEDRSVQISKGEDRIDMVLGSKLVNVGERKVEIEQVPFILKGNVMVPIRFIAENMGYKVDWDGGEIMIQ